MSSIIILVQLIAAHILCDFIFQTDKLCKRKFSVQPLRRFPALFIHSIIVAVLSYLFLAQWQNWIIPTIIFTSHLTIDWIKVASGKNGFISFVIDQSAHLIIIVGIWLMYIEGIFQVSASPYIFSLKFWVITCSILAVLKPTSILIKLFLEHENWTPEGAVFKGLPNAGKWIGYLERILILIFIYSSNLEAIGFLLAAKSVFRFGELNKSRDIRVTEYVLIGTLMSFTIAIILGTAAIKLLNHSLE